MAKPRPETILLKGKRHLAEGVTSAIIKPGQIVTYDFAPAVAASAGVVRVVTENDLVGKTIDDIYAVGEQAYTHIPMSGDIVLLRVPAGNAAIAQGELLKRTAGGAIVGGGVRADAIAEAEESIDNSGASVEAFIIARII